MVSISSKHEMQLQKKVELESPVDFDIAEPIDEVEIESELAEGL